MIPNQRHLFDLPDDVAYLNIAYTAPLLHAAARAGRDAIQAKQNPWTIASIDFFKSVETVRDLFAEIVGCNSDCVAIIPAVSYGIALAAKNIPIEEGQSIVVLQDQFPSNVYSWRSLATRKNAVIKTVPRPIDNDWTPALLESIEDNTAVVAVSNCHWTDGTLVDLEKIGKQCRSKGTALVIDGIQSLGALPFSVERVQPDFLVAGTHKWLLGPYSYGFCYVDTKWHQGVGLEENWMNRAESEDFSRLVDYRDGYQKGARRFDMGESSSFILSPIAAAALKQILDWGVENIAVTLQAKTDAIADRAMEIGLVAAPKHARAPHLIGISKPGGFPKELPNLLAQEKIFVSVRGESIRIAPHLYTSKEDIERLFSALRKAI
ncbi:MAG: aminotransferase class V-fold PLP-dependent enzyme [Deltaproteobacteria bacterium]|jgi:selenocysteine lyase/cysteine desulfurase|nr:aminotransferase class V-fold PLP-dependent enzyme [Deltaproteobacteria bacterium]